MKSITPLKIAVAALLGFLVCQSVYAQDVLGPLPKNPPGLDNVKPKILDSVGIDQNLGIQIPTDLVFKDEVGNDVHIGDYFGKRPIILTLVYYDCPMLCTMVLNDTLRTVKSMTETVGKDFDIITVSFDPRDTPVLARAKKASYLAQYNRPGAEAGWHFLTGNADSIARLTSTVGFKYKWDDKAKVFAHAAGLIVLTPDGKVSKYFFGIEYVPNDIRLAMVEAKGEKVGSLAETILLYCFHYDPSTGRYGLAVDRALKIGGALTLLGLGSLIGMMVFRGHRHGLNPATGGLDLTKTGDKTTKH